MEKNIRIKYDVGDSIRYNERTHKPIVVDCPCCGGKGYITGCDGNHYECGYCEGMGKYSTENFKEEVVEKTGTISRVIVKFDSAMDCYHGKAQIYYHVPYSIKNIMQEDIIERIADE